MYATIVSLLETLLGVGLVTGVLVTGVVYLDSLRRGVSLPARLRRALACGGGSFGGFLVPHVFSQQLQHLYFQVLKSQPIAGSPREWRSVSLTTGLLIAIGLVGLYFAANHFQNMPLAEQH